MKVTRLKTPDTAMILAAGLGTRMRPITDNMPKPLVRVFGKTLLDHNLDKLAAAGVSRTVVNVHYLASQVEEHLSGRETPAITISDERDGLLESGGGVKKALPKLGKAPFFLMNSDSFWLEGSLPNLRQMAASFDESRMDMMLMLCGMSDSVGYDGKGDFYMDPDGKLSRRTENRVAPFAYAGAAIIHPRVFENAPDVPFSLNRLFDEAIEKDRLYGMRMQGLWLHVGTPDAIRAAEEAIARSAA